MALPDTQPMTRPLLASAALAALLLGAGTRAAQQAATPPPPAPATPPAPAPAPPRPPAPTLARPTTASKAPDAAGFIQRWLVLEPMRVPPQLTETAVRAAVAKAGLGGDQLTTLPRDGQTVSAEGGPLLWHAVDTRGYNVNLFHFAYALNRPTSNVLFQAATSIDLPREMSGVRLAVGSNAASIWWLNGDEVISLYNDRQAVIDDGVSKRVTLRKGTNIIRAAIVNAGGATDFCARILDEEGQPVKTFAVTLGPGTSPAR
jgi:hypothetical protein